jgi:hypothetical protein
MIPHLDGVHPIIVATANIQSGNGVKGAAMFRNHAGTRGDSRSDLHVLAFVCMYTYICSGTMQEPEETAEVTCMCWRLCVCIHIYVYLENMCLCTLEQQRLARWRTRTRICTCIHMYTRTHAHICIKINVLDIMLMCQAPVSYDVKTSADKGYVSTCMHTYMHIYLLHILTRKRRASTKAPCPWFARVATLLSRETCEPEFRAQWMRTTCVPWRLRAENVKIHRELRSDAEQRCEYLSHRAVQDDINVYAVVRPPPDVWLSRRRNGEPVHALHVSCVHTCRSTDGHTLFFPVGEMLCTCMLPA